MFLDKDRNPIQGLEYILEYAGKSIKGVTEQNGLGKQIFTDTAEDQVRIIVKRLDGTLKELTPVLSGCRNKLLTLVSPSVKLEAKMEKASRLKTG